MWLDSVEYIVMKCATQQKGLFSLADMCRMLKKAEPNGWTAKDVEIALEWLAIKRMLKKKHKKEGFLSFRKAYQSCYTYDFFVSHAKSFEDIEEMQAASREGLSWFRLMLGRMKESHIARMYSFKYAIAITEEFEPLTNEEKERLKESIKNLE